MANNDWYVLPTSVGGRQTGPVMLYDYAEAKYNEYTSGNWTATPTGYDGKSWGFIQQGSRSNPDPGYAPQTDYASGWDPRLDTYPVNYFIFKIDNEGTPVYIRMHGDGSGSTYLSFDISFDEGTTWTVMGGSTGFLTYEWACPMQRIIDGIQYIGIATFWKDTSDRWVRNGVYMDLSKIRELIGPLEGEEESPDFGEESTSAGYDGNGLFDDSSDTIGVPSDPSIGVTDVGFVNVYNPSVAGLTQLGAEIFPQFTTITPYSPTGNTVVDALTDVAECLINIGNMIPNIMDVIQSAVLINYVVDCHVIPVAPTTSGATAIKLGYKTLGISAPAVTSDYVTFDCGSIQIGEYYGNFIDYAPFTQIKLFLPFVGFVPIEPEYVQSGTLSVKYKFNIIDGSFMAYVLSSSSKSKLSNTVIAQYGGNACVHIPVTGVNYANMVSGIAAGSVGAATALMAGDAKGVASNALQMASMGPMLQSSNGYNATTSFLSVRVPYLVIERSVSHFSRHYSEENGLPSHINADFSKLIGYTEASKVHMDGITATEAEVKQIEALLASGVIF